MKRIYVVSLLIALFTTGCQSMRQEVEPAGLSQVAKKLVIIGFISPQDTVLAVKVNITRPIADANYTTNYGTVANAKVVLETGNRSVQLTYNSKNDYYQVDAKKFPVRAGETYQLTAQTPDGLKASGSCTIPQPAVLQKVRLDSVGDATNQKQYFVRYYWQDVSAMTNYYQTVGIFTYAKSCPTCKSEAGAKPKPETTPVVFESLGQAGTLLSDQANNGRVLESCRGFLNQSSTALPVSDKITFPNLYDRAFVRATLLNVDEAYYKYHQALELQKKSDGNPFAEPVLLPNTITGGLGCFAGFNQSTVTATFK
ncbi:DUF4249 domain-containing protein [Larkinella terrae]|uniref:DUF4249 family protein n=1 Tax=Larkinella terrae TaxID=2025311 RepID=A0A7K0EQX7_9BACT|nr:DUF4249 domain-containing protein [Larkinella terrae]MRS64162.1 DUF4249 family protein [Larkinella terrae]